MEGATPYDTLSTFEEDINYQEIPRAAGTPLHALAQGRHVGDTGDEASLALGQPILDPADPAVYARHFWKDLFIIPVPMTGTTPWS